MEHKTADSPRKKPVKPGMILILIGIIMIAVMQVIHIAGNQEGKKEIVTISTLEKIVNVSELSTFTAVYNGIARVPEENAPEKTAYYVAYEAKVNAGVDFEKIGFSVDDEEKIIRAALPEVDIIDVNVDIASMDYIFVNKKMNTSTVSQEAYKACEADARSECEQEAAIFNLARQNAENIVTALIEPFVKQLDAGYKLEIDWEG